MAQHSFTITGNVTNVPELREVGKTELTTFRIGANRNRKDETGAWVQNDTLFLSVECWGKLAQHTHQTIRRGSPVIVVGTLVTKEWTDADGQNRSRLVLRASHIGPDLNRYVAVTARPELVTAEGETITADPRSQLEATSLGATATDTASDRRAAGSPTEPAEPAEAAESGAFSDAGPTAKPKRSGKGAGKKRKLVGAGSGASAGAAEDAEPPF